MIDVATLEQLTRLANTDWAGPAAFAEVGHIEAHLDLWSLFGGPIIIHKLDVDNGTARLARSEETGHNWPRPLRKERTAEVPRDDAGREVLLRIEEASIDQVQVSYSWPSRPDGLLVEVRSLRQLHGEDDYLSLTAGVSVDGHALDIEGRAGSWTSLITGRNFEYELGVVGPDGRLAASGSFASIARLDGIVFDVSVKGPDFGRVMAIFGSERFAGQPFAADIDARSEVEGLSIRDASANIGDTLLALSGVMPGFPKVDDAQLEARASGPDVGLVRELVGAGPGATGAFDIVANIEGLDDGTERVTAQVTTEFFEGRGVGIFDLFRGLTGGRVSIEADTGSMRRLLAIWGVDGLPDEAATITGGIEYLGERINFFEALHVETGTAVLDIGGSVSLETGVLGSELEVAVRGESLPAVLDALELDLLAPELEFESRGQLLVETGAYRLNAVSGRLGQTDFEFDGVLATQNAFAGSSITYTVSGPAILIAYAAALALAILGSHVLYALLAPRKSSSLRSETTQAAGSEIRQSTRSATPSAEAVPATAPLMASA